MDFQQTIVVGRVTAKPELRTMQSGQPVSHFYVATNRAWTDKNGQKQEEVEFHSVVAFGRQAEIAAQYLEKGSGVLIAGRLRTRTWQDKNGADRKTTEIICEHLQLGSKPTGKVDGVRPPKEREPLAAEETVPDIHLSEEEIDPNSIPF